MSTLERVLRDQRGVALPLAMFSLVSLSVMALAFVAMAAMEPQVSANLGDTVSARFIAEAGVEWAFDNLANPAMDWTTVLTDAIATANCTANGCLYGAANQTLPGLNAGSGTYTVRVRNDNVAGDTARTGLVALDAGGANTDTNGRVFITVTGAVNGVQRNIEVVVRRMMLPNFPGAVNLPGMQADTLFSGTERFRIDGRDYRNSTLDPFNVNNAGNCGSSCGALFPENAPTPWLPGGTGATKLGVAVQPGTQSNQTCGSGSGCVGGHVTYEKHVEDSLDTTNKQGRVKGRDQTNGSATTTGVNTVAADSSLTPSAMSQFVSAMASLPITQIFQSTQACPMRADATTTDHVVRLRNNGGPSVSSTNAKSSACPMDQNLDLGTLSDPKVVYFRGDPDPSSTFPGLTMNGTVKGAGLLIIEDGDFRQNANFTWDGLVVVTGQYVSIGMFSGSTTNIVGALTALETQAGEAGGYFEFLAGAGGDIASASIRNGTANINMVKTLLWNRQYHSLGSWREF
jgi:Tfp pilus assembly protein PilX